MLKKVIFYFAMFFLLQFVAISLVMVVGNLLMGRPMQSLTAFQQLIMQGIFTLITAILFMWRKWSPVSGNWIRTRPWAVMAWATVAAVGTLLPSSWLQEHLDFLPDITGNDILTLINQRGGYFVVAILVPLCEELVFRGAILRTLLGYGEKDGGKALRPWTAIALSALIFSLAHGNPAQMPHAFILGLLLGWLYQRTGSIIPGLILHIVNNTAAYLLVRAYPGMPDITLKELLGGSSQAVAMAIVFSLLILVPALFQLHLRMRREP